MPPQRRPQGGDGAAGLPVDVGEACPFPETTTGQELGGEPLFVQEIVDARLVPATGMSSAANHLVTVVTEVPTSAAIASAVLIRER